MKLPVWIGVVGALLGVAGVAHAEGKPAPGWCGDGKGMSQGFADQVNKGDNYDQVIAVAYLKCHPHEVDSKDVGAIDAAYARLNQDLGMTDADWADVADFARSDRGAIVNSEVRVKDDKAGWGARDPIEQFATFGHATLRTPGLYGELDSYYLADSLGPKLSALGRLALVRECLHRDKPVEWAMCQGDIDALDWKAIADEIRADKAHDGFSRIAVRLAAQKIRGQLKARADEIAALKKKDKGYEQMFDLAAKERAADEARWKSEPDLMAFAAAMDEAVVTNSRHASEGCKDKAWDFLAAAIRKLPAKSFVTHRKPDQEEVLYNGDAIETVESSILADPDAFIAANAYATCYVLEDGKNQMKDDLALAFQPRLTRWPGFRGPRTSAHSRILLADIKLDDRDARIDFPSFERIWYGDRREGGSASGVVAGIKPGKEKDEAVVSFEAKPVKEIVDTGCSQGRLHGIRADGSLEYEVNCTGSKTISVDHRPSPQTVLARYTKNLKAGMDVIISKDAVWITFPKAGAAMPSQILGQPVK